MCGGGAGCVSVCDHNNISTYPPCVEENRRRDTRCVAAFGNYFQIHRIIYVCIYECVSACVCVCVCACICVYVRAYDRKRERKRGSAIERGRDRDRDRGECFVKTT